MKFTSKRFLGIAILIVGLALCGVGLWLLLSPAQYQSAVRVKFGHDDGSYDPYYIQTEFEIIKSGIILNTVVEKLDLCENWDGKKNLEEERAVHMLKRRTIVQPVGYFSYILEIRVTDKEPEMAAQIANAIGNAYCDYRIRRIQQGRAEGIKALEDGYQRVGADIKFNQGQLEKLRNQLNIPSPEPTDTVLESNYPAYFQAKQGLITEKIYLNQIKAKIESYQSMDNSDAALVKEYTIYIAAPAVPAKSPIGPNRSLGIILLFCGLATSVLGAYLISISGATTKLES